MAKIQVDVRAFSMVRHDTNIAANQMFVISSQRYCDVTHSLPSVHQETK